MAVTAHFTNVHMLLLLLHSVQYAICESSGWQAVGLCFIATLLAYINIDTMAIVNMVQWFFISAFQSIS